MPAPAGGTSARVDARRGDDPVVGSVAWAYRPALDGLRAVAVYLVVGFHAGLGRLAGGFIGVDVFFVLSGYLVTNVLLRDLAGPGGRVRFGRFYARRVRRLLPAATVVLLATALVWSLVAGPVEVVEARAGFRAAALYVSNWYFISEATSYFGSDVEGSPVAHFWSLSVEEQFYVFWPVALSALFWVGGRFGRRRDLVVRLLVLGLGLASVGLALAWSESRLDRAYFGTDTRAYQLLAGALLALTPAVVGWVRGRVSVGVVAGLAGAFVVGLGVLASDVVAVNPVQRGVLATVVAMGLLVTLEGAPAGWVARALSWTPVVYLGQISYGTYLWHWLVTLVVGRELVLSDRSTAVVVAVVATGLASVSYQLLEMPVRQWSRLDRPGWRLPVVATGLVVSLVVALVVVPRVDSRVGTVGGGDAQGLTSDVRALLTHLTPVPPDIDHWAVFADVSTPEMDCVDGPTSNCVVVQGDGPTLLLMGDSTAHMMLPAFIDLAEQHDLTLVDATRSGCPWQKDLDHPVGADTQAQCRRIRPDTYARVVPELDPDLIVVMNTETNLEPFTGRPVQVGERDRTIEALDLLERPGRTIVLLESVPIDEVDGFDAAQCLQTAQFAEECRFSAAAAPSWMHDLLRAEAARRDDVVSIDLDHLVCPLLPICDPIVDHTPVWRLEGHLTGTYVRAIGPRLEQAMVAAGVPLP